MKDKKEKIEDNNQITKQEKSLIKKENDKSSKEKETSKFVQILKTKWLVDGTKTLILILLIILVFIAINITMENLDLTPIDLTQEKLYTLTDESKEKVKDLDKKVNIYFVGYSEDSTEVILAKQYKNANENINVETVTSETRPDLAEKYGIDLESTGIIVECGERSKVLTSSDLVTYDSTTYETISIAEEKLTSSIMSVTADKIPKVYFLEGYSEFSLDENMSYLNVLLQNEITEIDTLNILSTGNIPEDCDTLVITSLSKDFDDIAKNAITNYINNGGNILWLNAAITISKDFPNANEILALYGVEPFQVGVIRETDSAKMVSGNANLIIPVLGYSTITEDLYSDGVIFANATKININEEKLEELNVEKTDLATTSENAYFRTNFNNNSSTIEEGEEKGTFIVGAELEKTLTTENEEEKTSTLIIYGENYFASDYLLTQNSQVPMIQMAYNKDLILNSIAYLSDREEDITARKSTGTVTYTATEQQDNIVRIIIFAVPLIIILIGLIVWQKRRRKK